MKRIVIDLPTLPVFTDEPCQRCGGYAREINVEATNQEINRRAGVLGYSQKETASLANLREAYLCDILKGRRVWNIHRLLQLASALQ